MPRSAAPYRCGIGSAMSLPLHSATDHEAGDAAAKAGDRFARALAAKDSATLRSLIADTVDFQALTPGRHWRAAKHNGVVGHNGVCKKVAADHDLPRPRRAMTHPLPPRGRH